MEIKKLGTQVYLVHKQWKNKKFGAKIVPAKIVSYQNIEGEIYPILKSGSKEISPETNHIYYELEQAIKAII